MACQDQKELVGNAITRFTSFFNLTGNPAISIPCGLHSSGLPMGIQLVGPHFGEQMLLEAANIFEGYLGELSKYHIKGPKDGDNVG